ncbi:MAG: hypothetical protein ACR2ON_03270 [Paracoccaceae bacterium]
MDTKFVDPANAIRIKIMTPLTHQLHRPLEQNRLASKPKKRKAKAPAKAPKPKKAPKKKPKKSIIRSALQRMTDKKLGFKNTQTPTVKVDFSDIVVRGIPGGMRLSNAPGQINPANEPRAAEARPADTLELGRSYRAGLQARGSSRRSRAATTIGSEMGPAQGLFPTRGGNVSGRSMITPGRDRPSGVGFPSLLRDFGAAGRSEGERSGGEIRPRPTPTGLGFDSDGDDF